MAEPAVLRTGEGKCEGCRHAAHAPGKCAANIGTGYFGPVSCQCGVATEKGTSRG